jgi:hypothetical protein
LKKEMNTTSMTQGEIIKRTKVLVGEEWGITAEISYFKNKG